MKITKTQLKKMIQEELGGMERGDLARRSMRPERPYAQNVLAAAIEAISEHQTQMGEPSNLLTYALEQLNELMGHLRSGEEESEPERDERSYQMDLDDRAMEAGAWQEED